MTINLLFPGFWLRRLSVQSMDSALKYIEVFKNVKKLYNCSYLKKGTSILWKRPCLKVLKTVILCP